MFRLCSLNVCRFNVYFPSYLPVLTEYTINHSLKDLRIGDNIIINPPQKSYKEGEPWLARVVGITKRKVTFEFFAGTYSTVWRLGVFCHDSIARSRVECIVAWNEKLPMPKEMVAELRAKLDG